MLDLQRVVRGSLDVRRDGVAVRRPGAERLQDQQIEGALEDVDALS